MKKKKNDDLGETAFGILLLAGMALVCIFGSPEWSWWYLTIPLITSSLGTIGAFRVRSMLVPLASSCDGVIEGGVGRKYLSYYVFGIRVIKLHLDR